MDRETIIREIIRTATENNGVPPGTQKFYSLTGIKSTDWYGKYWARWSDALTEAGFQPNSFNEAYDEDFIIQKFVLLIRELKKFPTMAELRLKANNDKTFPTHNVFDRLGNKNQKIDKIIAYCKTVGKHDDVLEICKDITPAVEKPYSKSDIAPLDAVYGFVYLMKSGKYYKIGRSNDAERRAYDIRLQMPESLDLVHKIRTDDPAGIEEYWHKRFKDKRKNGEWFEQTRQDIEIFKRRKFM